MSLPGVAQLLRLDETDSTQTVARFLAEQGAPHGTLVWALRQTAGRGRMDRRWDSKAGGLYFSLILRPRFPASRLAEVSLASAEAAAGSLRALAGLETRVKPPNDVLGVDGRGRARKLCGILAEASGRSRKLDWLILGVGVNVNNAPSPASAASLKGLTGRRWPVEAVLKRLLKALIPAVESLERGGAAWANR